MNQTLPRVLIVCTGNSCRSHMAEGILRSIAGDLFDVHSAGSAPAGYVHANAISALAEIGIDISAHQSKSTETFRSTDVNTVITVCDNAAKACPVFPSQEASYHWEFVDPAHAQGSDEEVMQVFRTIRDQIRLVFTAYATGYRAALGRNDKGNGSDLLEHDYANLS